MLAVDFEYVRPEEDHQNSQQVNQNRHSQGQITEAITEQPVEDQQAIVQAFKRTNIAQEKRVQNDLPQGLKTYIYSFLTMTDLIEKISRLSSKQREIIQNSEILDQPRNLKVIVTDSQEYQRYVTQITRYDHSIKEMVKITQSAYQIDFERLEYLISLLNGDLTVKIENFY